MYEDVLVPTDGREATDRAIDEAIGLADAHGATLHALYVINSTAIAPGVDFEDLEDVGRRAVDHVRDRAAERGVADATGAVTRGLRHRAIVDYADDHDVDLIVMGRGRRVDRFVRPGVSDRVSEESSVPVLVVE